MHAPNREASSAAELGLRDSMRAAGELHAHLKGWLLGAAYPLWAQAGYDLRDGGFYERLSADGPETTDARRARVQVRQIYAFAKAPHLGWPDDPAPLIEAAWASFVARYRRADGLFRALCSADGAPLDERAFLDDQASVLLALSACQTIRALGARPHTEALALLNNLRQVLKSPGLGLDSGVAERLADGHAHLLEAALAWSALSEAPEWRLLVDETVELALTRFIDPRTGTLLERLGEDWLPIAGVEGHIIEPGRLYKWAWLLRRCGGERATAAATRLLDIAEAHGVRRGVVINAMLDDFTVHDGQARLWPQTERLKALGLACVNDGRYWTAVVAAGRALLRYLAVAPEGLWYDTITVNRRFIAEPSPASTLYHLVTAIAQLGSALATTDASA
jgi:mannose-6-phosphate isomerase